MYETFEHTADLGLRVQAPDLNTLFSEAGRGLYSMMVDHVEDVLQVQSVAFQVFGEDREYLLFDWLNELLFHFDSTKMLLSRFDVEVGPEGLKAIGFGEPLDPERHHLAHEVKAITYHRLKVEETPEGWLAEVIVDI
jgi:SHS2 domain-containing protein